MADNNFDGKFCYILLYLFVNLKVGSNITITDPDSGVRYRGREYPWGCVNIEDKVRHTSHMDRMILEGYQILGLFQSLNPM